MHMREARRGWAQLFVRSRAFWLLLLAPWACTDTGAVSSELQPGSDMATDHFVPSRPEAVTWGEYPLD